MADLPELAQSAFQGTPPVPPVEPDPQSFTLVAGEYVLLDSPEATAAAFASVDVTLDQIEHGLADVAADDVAGLKQQMQALVVALHSIVRAQSVRPKRRKFVPPPTREFTAEDIERWQQQRQRQQRSSNEQPKDNDKA